MAQYELIEQGQVFHAFEAEDMDAALEIARKQPCNYVDYACDPDPGEEYPSELTAEWTVGLVDGDPGEQPEDLSQTITRRMPRPADHPRYR